MRQSTTLILAAIESLRTQLNALEVAAQREDQEAIRSASGWIKTDAKVIDQNCIFLQEELLISRSGNAPTCKVCKDSHVMILDDRAVPCTFCPVPCKECRLDKIGAYCESTPCPCDCHKKDQPPAPVPCGKDQGEENRAPTPFTDIVNGTLIPSISYPFCRRCLARRPCDCGEAL